MFTVIAMSSVSVAACLVTLSRVVGWKAILKHATIIDVSFTLILGWFMAGTLTGALVAILGGLIMALVLTGLKHIMGLVETVACKMGTDSEYDKDGVWIYNKAPYV